LFGPTCDSIDVICDCVELPELDIGDWLLFPQMGAYTIAAASSFNGFSPPQSSYIMSWEE
jgi:ornithine decarboxylase